MTRYFSANSNERVAKARIVVRRPETPKIDGNNTAISLDGVGDDTGRRANA